MDDALKQGYEQLEEDIRSAMKARRSNKSLMRIPLNTLLLHPDSCHAYLLKGDTAAICWPLHRLHDNKRIVQVDDYIDNGIPMLARMYERRLRGYSATGYAIEQATGVPPLL